MKPTKAERDLDEINVKEVDRRWGIKNIHLLYLIDFNYVIYLLNFICMIYIIYVICVIYMNDETNVIRRGRGVLKICQNILVRRWVLSKKQ